MSWGEVKKINSDANVPLDERMTWFNGVLPRRNVLKQVSKSQSIETESSGGKPYSFEETLVEITGRGCIQQLKTVASGDSMSNNASVCTAKAQFDIIIDGRSITFGSSTCATNGNDPTATLDIALYTGNDFMEYDPTDVNNGIVLGDNASKTIKLVDPVLMFKNSLKIVGRISIVPGSYAKGSASLLASYRIFE